MLTGVEGLGALKLPAFFLLWVVAKTFCVDALALVLALASGVIFGGVLEGGYGRGWMDGRRGGWTQIHQVLKFFIPSRLT